MIEMICYYAMILLLHGNTVFAKDRQCNYIISHGLNKCADRPPGISNDKTRRSANKTVGHCQNEQVCSKMYNLSLIDYMPYSKGMEKQCMQMFSHCCSQSCNNKQTWLHMKNISDINSQTLRTSDAVFPILARSSVKKLHGFHFIRFFEAPVAFYVFPSRAASTVVERMLKGASELWPLICGSLLLTVLSGFIAWLLDTWINEEDFPRPFLVGLFEGFWWSFISMTTVGYGDKAPKSRWARLFSVVWILLGLLYQVHLLSLQIFLLKKNTSQIFSSTRS